MATLKEKTVSGVKWQVVNRVAQKVISVATFAVLARLLEPSAFGLFAMAFILIDGLAIFQSMGIDSGLIQRQDVSRKILNTAFFIVLGMGVLICGICFLTAPIAGMLFKNEHVDEIIRVLGIIFILSCSSRIPQTVLVKQMRFKLTSTIQIIATIANSVFAIIFALISPTVWALVWAYLIKQSLTTALTWYYSKFEFRFEFDAKAAKELLHFGKFLVGGSIIWYININISMMVVARVLGATALGFLALARNIGGFINTHFTQLISRVMFPAFAKIQHDPMALKRAYLKSVRYISLVVFPFSVSLIFLAKEFTLTLYGAKWEEIIPLIQLMGLMQLLGGPLLVNTGAIYNACNRPGYGYWQGVLSLSLKIPFLTYFTWKWGILGAVGAQLPVSLIMIPVSLHYLRKVVPFDIAELLSEIRTPLIASLMMACGFFMMRVLLNESVFFASETLNHAAHLALHLMAGMSAYFGSILLFDRPVSNELLKMIFRVEETAV